MKNKMAFGGHAILRYLKKLFTITDEKENNDSIVQGKLKTSYLLPRQADCSKGDY